MSKKEKKNKKLQELSYEFDNSIAYDITKYFSSLSIKNNNKISFESDFYQIEIFNSKNYSDEKLKQNKIYFSMQNQVKYLILRNRSKKKLRIISN